MPLLVDDDAPGLCLAEPGRTTVIAVSDAESSAVRRAAADLARDMTKVCGAATRTVQEAAEARIVVGTIGVSPAVDAAVASGALDVADLRNEDGAWRWEGMLLQTVGETLYVVGTDRRGTVFAAYRLCEAMGVSPWWWFADVPVRARPRVVVSSAAHLADHPSVRYRGVFLNDEEELDAWAQAHTRDGTIGPETYERVFELILRLGGNYIWPAMHVNYFNGDVDNGRLAHEMGVVVGTSHCDMLLRSNQNEWGPWLATQDEHVAYDYSVPGANRERLQEYWRGSVEQNRDYEVGWTVGMRGIHDTGFLTTQIDADPHLTDAEKRRARVALLEQVMHDQRAILADVLGEGDERAALQAFVPYKEVLPLYDDGLQVPDDVMIVWVDDNFGYVRRYPDAAERTRAGGHGLYYHSSYWAPPPLSYLFISSIPLAHMKNELRKAWDNGIRTLWVDNIGALKPLEQDMEFFLRYGWQVGKETTTADVTAFTAQWVDGMFTGGHGRRVARLYDEFAQVTNVRKLEHLVGRAFSQTGHGDEALRRVQRLRDIYAQVTEILTSLPVAEREAFFQLIAMKIHASYLINAQFYFADRSTLAHEQGKLAAADHYLALFRELDDHKRAMLRYYNQTMADGKWDQILTPEAFSPPPTALFPAGAPALRIGAPGLGVTTWQGARPGGERRLTFSPYGTAHQWIEIFTTGTGGLRYTVEADPWITVSRTSGTTDTEERVTVGLLDPVAAAGRWGQVVVHSPTDGSTVVIEVDVEELTAVPADGSLVEGDGYVSVRADDPDVVHDGAESAWVAVPALGRHEGALMEVRPTTPGAPRAETPPSHADSAWLGYRIHLMSAGAHVLELHRFPSLDSTGRIRLAVAVDDLPAVVVESPTTDEWRGAWTTAVTQNVERLRVRLPYLAAGEHLLKVHAVDDLVSFSALVVHTAPSEPTTLALPPSRRAGAAGDRAPDGSPDSLVDRELLARARELVYRSGPEPVPPHPVVYTPATYWEGDTLYGRAEVVAQERLAPPRYRGAADGSKDVLAALGSGALVEHDGVLRVEAEYCLAEDADAYRTPSLDGPTVGWTHTQAETDGRTGLAMHVDARGRTWQDPRDAPGLHWRVEVQTAGTYHVWALVKFDSETDDAFALALDGTPQPLADQVAGGRMFTFSTAQVWQWAHVSDLDVAAGTHTLSALAVKAGLRVDRLYLTLGDERPPADADWDPPRRAVRDAGDPAAPAALGDEEAGS
jgi:hypothetical protein